MLHEKPLFNRFLVTETESTYVMIESTVPSSSKVTYAVKRMERETAWERG